MHWSHNFFQIFSGVAPCKNINLIKWTLGFTQTEFWSSIRKENLRLSPCVNTVSHSTHLGRIGMIVKNLLHYIHLWVSQEPCGAHFLCFKQNSCMHFRSICCILPSYHSTVLPVMKHPTSYTSVCHCVIVNGKSPHLIFQMFHGICVNKHVKTV